MEENETTKLIRMPTNGYYKDIFLSVKTKALACPIGRQVFFVKNLRKPKNILT